MQTYARLVGDIVAEIIIIEADTPPLEERFHASLVEACVLVPAGVAIAVGDIHAGGAFSAPEAAPPPAPLLRTYKSDVWRRCTDEEAVLLDAALNEAPVKLRRLWADSTILEHESPEFEAVRQPMIALLGAERAAELLAPSAT